MSLIARFIAAAKAASDGWTVAGTAEPSPDSVGGFNSAADAEFAVTSREAAEPLIGLYGAARAIHARSILGFTFIRVGERRALAAAIAKLEA